MAASVTSAILSMADAADLKCGNAAWDRSTSSASTAEPACGEVWSGSDSEDEKEVDAAVEEKEAERDAVFSVTMALGVLILALLVWLYIPAMIFAPLFGFLVLEVTWFAHGPSHVLPAGLSGIVLLPLYLCGLAVFLACQTPQL
mmetsp:Transcript_14739/g.30897  ORF Transcript_14739/g.30897 Transcript_14739/m.30897 type:complete len:144 (+) Transcript_14739:92-523(+)